MTLDRLQELLDRCGSDLSQWAVEHRAAAERLIASDPAAAKIFEEATRFERLIERGLGKDAPARDDGDVISRIFARLDEKLPAQACRALPRQTAPGQNRSRFWPVLTQEAALAPRLAALSFAAALGVALGLFWAQTAPGQATEEASADVTSILFQTANAIGTF